MNCTVLSTRYEVYADTVLHYNSLEEIPLSQSSRHIVEIINTAGICNLQKGICECFPGFSGKDCADISICTDTCKIHGKCVNGICECELGYHGQNCEDTECINNCNNRGECINGKCICVQS